MSRIHELKTWPEPFEAILQGRKRHEVRRDDRGFAVGDLLHLKEWSPDAFGLEVHGYTGRECKVRVTYLTKPGTFGLSRDTCVMTVAFAGVVS